MHSSLRSIFTTRGHRTPEQPVLVLVDSEANTNAVEVTEMLQSLVASEDVSGPHAIAAECAPGDLDRWAPRKCELVVLVSNRPHIARSVAQECQRRGIALCRLQVPVAVHARVPASRVA
jgi:hypothetical protein